MSSFLDPAAYAFNPFASPTLLAAASSFLLGAAAVGRERRTRESLAFFLLCGLVGGWLLCTSFLYLSSTEETALPWAKAMWVVVLFIPPAVYLFATEVLDRTADRRGIVASSWALFGVFAVASLATDRILEGIRIQPWGFFPRLGVAALPILVPYVGLLLLGLWEFVTAYRTGEPGTARLRARTFLVAFAVSYVALVDYLPAFGLEVYAIGYVPIFGFLSISAWAIWRYRLTDLTPDFVAEALVRTMPDLLLVCDAAGSIRLSNPAVSSALGYEEEELLGEPVLRLAGSEGAERLLQDALVRSTVLDRGTVLRGKAGEPVEASLSTTELRDDNDYRVGTVLVARDIGRRKELERELMRRVLFDELTGLASRPLLLERIERALVRARRSAESFALLIVDVDRFELVKDSLGHPAADELLTRLADRLRVCVREVDTAARVAGDQFAVLLRGIEDAGSAIHAATRIQLALAPAVALRGQRLFPTVGVGIALGAPHYETPEEVLRDAHAAMRRAKGRGVAQIEVFDPEIRSHALARLQVESELRQALEREEFLLHYQPIVSLETGRPVACEALLRWKHPSGGLLLPDDFLDVARETGLLPRVGAWVLARASRTLRDWRSGAPGAGDLRMHVNLSVDELEHPALMQALEAAVRDTGLEPASLVLEITETAAMSDGDRMHHLMNAIHTRGHHLCIDDFGTGYSSLAYLQRFPIDMLKIDRSFVGACHDSEGDAEIVRAVVALSRSLGVEVIAEGVERQEHLRLLRELGCPFGQGYLLGRPAPETEAVELLRKGTAV